MPFIALVDRAIHTRHPSFADAGTNQEAIYDRVVRRLRDWAKTHGKIVKGRVTVSMSGNIGLGQDRELFQEVLFMVA